MRQNSNSKSAIQKDCPLLDYRVVMGKITNSLFPHAKRSLSGMAQHSGLSNVGAVYGSANT